MIFRKISIILILFSIWGCSTKKNTWLSRNYHDLTAYYNVYFNGREAFKTGDQAIIDGYENDYSNILPVFESSDPDAASVASGDMDRAIEKGQKLIKKHSITAKPKKRSRNNAYAAEFYSKKEFNKWVDNAYVLIGKAQIYKHEQSLGIRTLQKVVRDFPDTESFYEALIWQARAYTDKGDYIGAQAALESYDLGGNAPLEFYADYMSTYANLLLAQEKYVDAIPYLNNAVLNHKSKQKRLRYSYILGQLYLQNDQRQKAAESFAYVAKASTDYEMTFNAKVNQASIIYANADIAVVKKELNKLRKDKKNTEYLDRIYYAFGRVAQQENDEAEALSNYRKSINASVDNANQKGLSYREAGEIYYSNMDFANAYFYYDSALTVINQDYEEIEELKERHYGLSGLIDHLLTVEREDSLQRLADMSQPVLYAYLDDLIAEQEAEQKRLQKMQEEESMSDAFFYQNNNTSNNMGQTGKWYFYNQNSMGMGKMEFEKRWGKRKQEDNWRRKDKSKIAEEEENDEDQLSMPDDPFGGQNTNNPTQEQSSEDGESQNANESFTVQTREQLLADIPLSDSDRQASDDKIEAALLELGLVFMDRLQNYDKAIESLEELIARYPESSSRDEALIALYNAYRLNNDEAGMLATKEKIENEFPDHRFVAYLNDPDFLKKILDKKEQESKSYEATYEAFLFGRFNEVISKSNLAISNTNEDSQLTNKYLLLRGLSYGKNGQVEPFKTDLTTIINNDKESDEAQLAQELLKHIEEGKTPVQGTLFAATPGQIGSQVSDDLDVDSLKQQADFVYVEKEPYQVVVMGIKEANLNRAIYHVADYNFSRYLLHDFEIQEQRLLNGSSIVVIDGFSNRVEVMDYFYGLRENPQFFGFDKINDNIVVLSESNHNKFYLSGLVKDYIQFFNKYYLQYANRQELEKVMRKAEPQEQDSTPVQEESSSEKTVIENKAEKETSTINPPNEVEVGNAEANKSVGETEASAAATTTVNATNKQKEIIEKEQVTEEEPVKEEPKSIYSVSKNESHEVLVVIRKTRIDYNKLQKSFAAHTRNNFGADQKVTLLDLGSSYRMIKISGFANADEANAYIKSIDKYPYLTRDIARKEHYIWSISSSNYKKMTELIDIEGYDSFFKTNY
ncbi:tetratricopeptide repeat protein [Carboxylicivirga sp. M1479]|uniref:type IX secretion system periplasmic lipoprotein PorW/SprE n=1 Tax=Carboxylicivirga sp. M1479 TaxID=2594476 RepID=UPI0011785246|nr:tetratricopeptide repeat protein [Carboxylicivirga sp. M1479]TRX72031.1 tetratricopeptide repeat protein [Carboxylicivirga sp. M1479]